MSLSLAFQAASKYKAKTKVRKLPHSKTFVGNLIPSPPKDDLINEIGETEENLSETEEHSESQNTFVFDHEKSLARMSVEKDQIILIPATKDFVSQDSDYENLDKWNFDITIIKNIMEKYRLIGTMFNSLGYMERFEIDLNVFGRFLQALQEKYNIRNNPFHNFDHGFTGKFKRKYEYFKFFS